MDGNFSIDLDGKPFLPLSVSAVGYYTTTITEYSPAENLAIYLKPKIYNLEEVVINAQSLTKHRKRNLKIFHNVFLGTSQNASRCILTNENDVTFNYASDKDTLKVFAYNPLHIKNPMLGYAITYHLDSFYYVRRTTEYFIKGEIVFEEDLTEDHNRGRIERRRYRAYQGSVMHFIASLWENKLSTEGFEVSINWNIINLADSVIVKDDNTKILHIPCSLYIRHNRHTSKAVPLKKAVQFDKYGNYVRDIIWEGDMATRRVGDWLPIEYYLN